eukprot:scaffold14347_cov50-Cyclotella_meneghiniana.AAC.1
MLLVTVKKKGGKELIDHYYSKTIEKLMQSDEWQRVGGSNFAIALERFMEDVEELEDLTDESIEELIESLKCPANLMQPNFGRWGTVSAASKIVLNHWTQIYFMAETIKKAEKAESYLYKISNSLLELMTAKAYKDQENPTHYVSLLFFNAFCETFFDRHMEWFKRNDPVFGEGSYGQISRLVPEHLHILFGQFRLMTTNNSWQILPQFKPFVEAVDGLRELGKDTKGGKEFYVRTTATFFQQFEQSFVKQVEQWMQPDVTWMAVAGQPMIAKWLVRKIANDESAPPELEVEMHHHYMGVGQRAPIVKVNECVESITGDHASEIFQQPFIQEFINELAIIADGDGTIDALDPLTWQGHDLRRLHEGIWNYIAPNSTHQQAAENLVQTANHLAKTNHGEARRTAGAMNHCLFARDFNRWAVGKLRRKKKREAERRKEANNEAGVMDADDVSNDKVRRPEGKQKLKMFIQYSDGILRSIATAKKALSATRLREIYNNMRTSKNKSSAIVAEEKKSLFNKALTKKLNPKEALSSDLSPVKSFLSFLAISALRLAASFASFTNLSHSSRVNSGVRSKVRDGKVLLGDRNRMKKIMIMPSNVRMEDRIETQTVEAAKQRRGRRPAAIAAQRRNVRVHNRVGCIGGRALLERWSGSMGRCMPWLVLCLVFVARGRKIAICDHSRQDIMISSKNTYQSQNWPANFNNITLSL